MLAVIGKMLLTQAVEISVNYVVPKAVEYMEKNIPRAFDYAGKNIPKAIDFAKKKYSDYKNHEENSVSEEEVTAEIIFDIIKIINNDTKILNNPDDKHNAKIIEKKLEKDSEFYKFLDINVDFVEGIIRAIRFDVNCRYSLLEELKKHPQIIKQKTSAIRKTVCANIGVKDENLANSISFEIDTIKKILELHKNKKSAKKIFEDIIARMKKVSDLHLNLKSISL